MKKKSLAANKRETGEIGKSRYGESAPTSLDEKSAKGSPYFQALAKINFHIDQALAAAREAMKAIMIQETIQ